MTNNKEVSLGNANTILLLGAERVGDMLFATPAIQMLRDYLPNATIDIVVYSELSKEVMLHNPSIDMIHVSPSRWKIKSLAKSYDITVAVHDNKDIRKIAPALQNIEIYKRDATPMHMKMYPIEFIRTLLEEPDLPYPESYQLYPQPLHFQYVEKLLREKGANPDTNNLICCHMGCQRVARRGRRLFKTKNVAGDTKCWEFSNYEDLARRLAHQHPDTKLVLTGTKGEQRIAKEYLSNCSNTIDLIGRTSILELAALMKYCSKFLSANTGPLHVACATDIPLVTLIGKHNPDVYGPSPRAAHRIVLRNKESVDNITVDEVQAALFRI